jgi:hypothetical protein
MRKALASALGALFAFTGTFPKGLAAPHTETISKVGTHDLWRMLSITVPASWRVAEEYPYNLGFSEFRLSSRTNGREVIELDLDDLDAASLWSDPRLPKTSMRIVINGMVGKRARYADRVFVRLLLPNVNAKGLQQCVKGLSVFLSYPSDEPIARRIVETIRPRKPLTCLTAVP